MIKNLKRILHITLFVILAALYTSGCAPTRLDIIPMEQVQQIETDKTTKKEIFDKLGPPKAIAAKDEVSTFPAERIAGHGRLTPPHYDSSIPIHEWKTRLPYYRIDSHTLFELFSKDRQLTEYHQIYYYSDGIPRKGVYEPESRLWILINEKTGTVEDYILRKHYNAVVGKDFLPVTPYYSEPSQALEEAKTRSSRIKPVKRRYWYIGVGRLSGTLSSNNPAFDGIDGSGAHFVAGLTSGRLSGEVNMGGFDFRTTEPTPDIYYPPDDASYSFFGVGLKFDFLDIDKMKWSPWVAWEWSQQDFGLSNYVYSMTGACSSPVAGLDVRLAKWLILRAGRRKCSYTANEYWFGGYSTNMDAKLYTVDAIFRFRMW